MTGFQTDIARTAWSRAPLSASDGLPSVRTGATVPTQPLFGKKEVTRSDASPSDEASPKPASDSFESTPHSLQAKLASVLCNDVKIMAGMGLKVVPPFVMAFSLFGGPVGFMLGTSASWMTARAGDFLLNQVPDHDGEKMSKTSRALLSLNKADLARLSEDAQQLDRLSDQLSNATEDLAELPLVGAAAVKLAQTFLKRDTIRTFLGGLSTTLHESKRLKQLQTAQVSLDVSQEPNPFKAVGKAAWGYTSLFLMFEAGPLLQKIGHRIPVPGVGKALETMGVALTTVQVGRTAFDLLSLFSGGKKTHAAAPPHDGASKD
jgi:hypothetical protein